ncbi:MAG: universal stress protein [Kiritimatiellae bacterium]|jgi:nucleotide-binding universal stress UspA family protein|nr:universal stress protein [Kiritimatiellia bacterium]
MKTEFNTDIQKILFCTDFAEDANNAFDVAISIAKAFNLRTIHLLHTIPEPDAQYWKTYIYELDDNVDLKAKHDVDEKIKKSYTSKLPADLTLNVNVKIGRDYMSIIEFAEENNMDMLIIGKATRSKFQGSFLGDAIKHIIRRAHCPVLVVPQKS